MRTLTAIGILLVALQSRAQVVDKVAADDRRQPSTDFVTPQEVPPQISQAVITLYEALADMPHPEQRHALLGISPDVRAQLWRYNLIQLQKRHPELQRDQADVIAAGITLIGTPHLLDAAPGTPDFAHSAQLITLYGKWAESALPPTLFYAAVINLGASEPPATSAPSMAAGAPGFQTPQSFLPKPETTYPCECATTTFINGWDCFANTHGVSCVPAPDLCVFHIGCGVFGQDTCNGFCV